MLVTIREGAKVGMDMQFWRWPNLPHAKPEQRFRATQSGDRYKLVADGFGSFEPGEEYGNGAVFANKEDVIPVEGYCEGHDEPLVPGVGCLSCYGEFA